jgi:hypothetical protein
MSAVACCDREARIGVPRRQARTGPGARPDEQRLGNHQRDLVEGVPISANGGGEASSLAGTVHPGRPPPLLEGVPQDGNPRPL